ncbi:hypothetical protein OA074_00445 [bacterium]|nr:hypothetical protein [bacterium]
MMSPMKKRKIPAKMLKRKEEFFAYNKFINSKIFKKFHKSLLRKNKKQIQNDIWLNLMSTAYHLSWLNVKKNSTKEIFNKAIKDGYKMDKLRKEIKDWYKKNV